MSVPQQTNLDVFEDKTLDSILTLLSTGEIEVVGQVTWSSNYTLLTQVKGAEGNIPAIYKPARGEAPLWDFPIGTLAARETAAYLTSHALGWDFVPPTVKRADGPAGPGSMQLYIEVDHERNYFTMHESEKPKLHSVALFDILINNADRKGGHVLLDEHNKIWLIDHGVCFHTKYKLRTVIWDFIGDPIPEPLHADLQNFLDTLTNTDDCISLLKTTINNEEIKALIQRGSSLLRQGTFPAPGPGRPYPWPLV